ncbi:MAG: hypothetical protein ABI333_19765 [bacterium]
MKRAAMSLVCALIGASAGSALGAPAAPAPPAAECTANIEDGKKYHWATHKGGRPLQSGYIQFTSKRYGAWAKVVHQTDRPKAKRTFWGRHATASLTIKSTSLKQRWTAYKKYCTGSKIMGTVFQNGQKIHAFTLDTGRVRD